VTLVSPLSPVPVLPRADAAQARPCRVSIVDVDRALVAHLDARELDLAQRYAGVVRTLVPSGRWDPSSMLDECGGGLGILILDGMVSREASFASGVALEILGPEDLIAPSFGPDVRWSAMRPLTAAVLDPTFAQVAARLPRLSAALLGRAHARSDRLAVHLAIAALPRVEDRLLGLLSLLAERFGRVGVDGLHLPLPLTHAVLGLLIGARRPTITLAVSALRERGALARTERGGWLLPHPPGEDVRELELSQAV